MGRLEEFLRGARHARGQVLAGDVPQRAGIYAWWFRDLPSDRIDPSACVKRDGLTLLYVGISPNKPTTSGRSRRSQNLRKRLRNHYRGRASTSTLRLSLGVLLAEQLGIELRRYGNAGKRHFGSGEWDLDRWMDTNTVVSWIESDEPWLLEDVFVSHLDVPLNLQGNSRNKFYGELRALRSRAAKRADELPALPNRGRHHDPGAGAVPPSG
ncbi:GIY-YIG nuclease family protein [Gordonia amicalis]|uniref:GIY-YIG catalytic domain-containing protein n=1 Tax=Gordonia amicalis TaxID=89053 RepID=A0ABU4D9S9_9ACTN|nr:hypothetical protein [Gordonia amicalis]MCZ4577587.1 hypothetical protein [Gordonia amicalis]MDV6305851.1 hypothetical protein [Gordonia amicalis]